MGPSPSPAWIPFLTAVYRAAAPRRSRPPPIRAVPGALPPSLRPIRSLRKDPVHGSFECSPTPVPHDCLRLPPPSSFGLALHRRSPPSEPWVSLAALQSSLRVPTLPPLASLVVLPVGVAGPTRPRRLASSRTGRRRRPSTPPLAAEARLPARALLLLALPRPDSCRSSPPAVLARRSPSIPTDVAPRHALPPKEARRPPLPVRGHVRDAPLPAGGAAGPALRAALKAHGRARSAALPTRRRRSSAHAQTGAPRAAAAELCPRLAARVTSALPAATARLASVCGSRDTGHVTSALAPAAAP